MWTGGRRGQVVMSRLLCLNESVELCYFTAAIGYSTDSTVAPEGSIVPG